MYVLGKAATLNADVGDVMISSVVHDEHSGSTYWLDNAFSVDDLAGDLRFGSGLDNQRAVTVKSTFLQNRAYLDFYYREAFTVVEMEAGPYCNALYEIADADRHPVGEAVNFSKLPLDFGIIHYASDTPYTQARTLGARGLSYYGMDSTYALVAGDHAADPAPRGRPLGPVRGWTIIVDEARPIGPRTGWTSCDSGIIFAPDPLRRPTGPSGALRPRWSLALSRVATVVQLLALQRPAA